MANHQIVFQLCNTLHYLINKPYKPPMYYAYLNIFRKKDGD